MKIKLKEILESSNTANIQWSTSVFKNNPNNPWQTSVFKNNPNNPWQTSVFVKEPEEESQIPEKESSGIHLGALATGIGGLGAIGGAYALGAFDGFND